MLEICVFPSKVLPRRHYLTMTLLRRGEEAEFHRERGRRSGARHTNGKGLVACKLLPN